MSRAVEGVVYPRDVPIEAGMPAGWRGVEKEYGSTSKSAGKTYIRYFTVDGRYGARGRGVCSPKQVIEIDCDEKSLESAPYIAEYLRLQKERHEAEAAERAAEREANGIVTGEPREKAIERFIERFGALSGPIVFQFPGWKTRWDYSPNSGQVAVTYTEPNGKEWKLLKDLESSLMIRIEAGTLPDGPSMIETGQGRADSAAFSVGSRTARECGGVFEIDPGTNESKVMTQEQRVQMQEERKMDKMQARKKHRKRYVFEADYASANLQVFDAGISSDDLLCRLNGAGLSESESKTMAKLVDDFSGYLGKRGFETCKQLLVVLSRSSHPLLNICCGVYYRMQDGFNERPFFRLVRESGEYSNRFVCCPHHIFWSVTECWKIGGPLKDDNAGVARCREDVASPVDCKSWRVIRTGAEPPGDQPIEDTKRPEEKTSSEPPKISSEPQKKVRKSKPLEEAGSDNQKKTRNATFEKKTSAEVEVKPLKEDDCGDQQDLPEASSSSKRPRDSTEKQGVEEDHENKVWSYGDCHNPDLVREGSQMKEIPAHWPVEVTPAPGRWSAWLPLDWGQGLKLKDSGVEATCFISPEGKIRMGRGAVEKDVGHPLHGSSGEGRWTLGAVPTWPDWLPEGWGLTLRETRGTDHTVFLPPGWESGMSRYYEWKGQVMKVVTDPPNGPPKKGTTILRLTHADNAKKGTPASKHQKVDHNNDAEEVREGTAKQEKNDRKEFDEAVEEDVAPMASLDDAGSAPVNREEGDGSLKSN